MEGDSVTLHTGVKTNQEDRIKWYFNDTRIAHINGDLSDVCTDVQCKERFRDRLKLDHQTGSLTITNTRTTDSGEYKRQIVIIRDSVTSQNIFSVSVNGVSAAERDEVKRKSVKRGESVTLDPGVTKNTNDSLTWYYNDIVIAEITGDQSKTCEDVRYKKGFRDRLKLDHQTGSLIITDTRSKDSGDYKLKVSRITYSIIRSFSVSVAGGIRTKHNDQMPSCGSCRAPLAQGDQHIICVSCLGESHAALALADGGCPHCDLLPMVTLRTRLASFSKSAFPAALPRRKKRRSQRAPEPALARPSSPVRPPASPASPVSLPDAQRPQSAAASSEEVVSEAASGEKDSCSLSVSGSEDWASSVDLAPPARKPTTRANIEKELMRVLVLAAESLGLEWSAPEPPSRTRLDGSFLPGERTSPESKPAPFLPELHEEVAKAWNAPFSARTRSSVSPAFSSLDNAKDRGYLSLPPVEQAIATHLCPPSAGRRTKPVLPSKACRMTSTLLARIFSAAGQAASALHTMATLQIFQGDLLRKWDEMGPEAICIADLRSASDLTLRATKSAAQAMGRCMASATVAERHLWLTLTEMADSERNAFLDAPLSPTGLFGSSLSEFVERFTEAQKASQAFKHFLPKRSGSAASRDKQTPRSSQHQPPPSAASSQQRQQRQQHSSRSRSRSTGRPAQRGPRPRIVVKPEAPKKS
ncbi:unnamed protein product [Leuciscus chuanchicus]